MRKLQTFIFAIFFAVIKLVFVVLSVVINTILMFFPNFFKYPAVVELLAFSPFRLESDEVEREIESLAAECSVRVKSHYACTEDGYILCLHRLSSAATTVTTAPELLSNQQRRLPVLVMHGLLQDSESFLCCGKDSLGALLVNDGYDVWLGNNRGNLYSHGHRTHHPDSSKYWDFSVDDLARFDIPAIIEYISHATDHDKLIVIGFSQGTAQMFAALSLFPRLNKSIALFVAVAPAVQAANFDNLLIASLAEFDPFVIKSLWGSKMMLPATPILRRYLKPSLFALFIEGILSFIFGWKFEEISSHRRAKVFQHVFSESSVKIVVHWFQIINAKRLCMFQQKSSMTWLFPKKCLHYDISVVTCPVASISGKADKLIVPSSIKDSVSSCILSHEEPDYEHLDMIWADSFASNIYPIIRELAQKYTKVD